jgi:hypothetical protein
VFFLKNLCGHGPIFHSPDNQGPERRHDRDE